MSVLRSTIPLILLAAVIATLSGCQPASTQHTAGHETGPAVEANLAKLPPEDRPLAEAQGYCAVESKERLGSMGVPIKVMVKDQPVFVCCKGCEKRAVKDADATLARVAGLKQKVAAEKAATP